MSGTRRYPWPNLSRPGAWFVWKDMQDEFNLRSAACKYAKRKGIRVSVARTAKGHGLLVTYERNRLL